MKKKAVILLLALAMIFSFAACGGDGKTNRQDNQGNANTDKDNADPDDSGDDGEEEPGGDEETEAPSYVYTWDITVVFPESDEGTTIMMTNPGLEGWDEEYMNQRFEFTKENNTAEMKIFDPSDWIVDNTQDWYKWVVNDGDSGYSFTYEVVTHLTEFDEATHGELTITLR